MGFVMTRGPVDLCLGTCVCVSECFPQVIIPWQWSSMVAWFGPDCCPIWCPLSGECVGGMWKVVAPLVVVCLWSFEFSFDLRTFLRPCGCFLLNKNSPFAHTTHFCIALLVPGNCILLFPSHNPLVSATGGNGVLHRFTEGYWTISA